MNEMHTALIYIRNECEVFDKNVVMQQNSAWASLTF